MKRQSEITSIILDTPRISDIQHPYLNHNNPAHQPIASHYLEYQQQKNRDAGYRIFWRSTESDETGSNRSSDYDCIFLDSDAYMVHISGSDFVSHISESQPIDLHYLDSAQTHEDLSKEVWVGVMLRRTRRVSIEFMLTACHLQYSWVIKFRNFQFNMTEIEMT